MEGAGAAAAANPKMATKTRARTMSLCAIFAYTENLCRCSSRTDGKRNTAGQNKDEEVDLEGGLLYRPEMW